MKKVDVYFEIAKKVSPNKSNEELLKIANEMIITDEKSYNDYCKKYDC